MVRKGVPTGKWTRRGFVVAVVLGGSATLVGGAAAQGADPSVKAPPAELARYYPPATKTRVYTAEMLELGRLMGATVSQARAKRWAAAAEDIAALQRQYRKVAGMVGVWTRHFPAAPLEKLQQVIAKRGTPDALQEAVGNVEEVCTSCHAREMFRVQARYHWGRFSKVTVAYGGTEMSFHESMTELSNLMAGIGGHASRGHFDAAAKEAAQLPRLFGALETACASCHTEKREYFVDARAKGRMLRLAGMVRQKVKNRARYDAAVAEINARSCIPCHQVHMPAAFLQQFWERGTKLGRRR